MKNENLAAKIKNRYVHQDEICLWYIGQEGFVIKNGNFVMSIDPYLSSSIDVLGDENLTRNYPPPVKPEDLKFVDLTVCSHDHQDHLDAVTIKGINSGENLFAVPVPVIEIVEACGVNSERILGLVEDEPFYFQGGKIIPVPAAHDSFHIIDGNYCELSYLIEFDCGLRLFHGGDMMIYSSLKERIAEFKPHVLMLPVNGRCYYREERGIVGNIGYREAVDFADKLDAKLLIPMHYDLYSGNCENPGVVIDYQFRAAPFLPVKMFVPGEAMVISAQDYI